MIALPLALLIGFSSVAAPADHAPARRPNILVILADDLGYGDVHALNPTRGKIPTPNIDRLAAQGMSFTDAHSGSSVCTPTRYGLLTGRYCWRTRLQSGVLNGTSPHLIDPARLTLPGLLRRHGYATACFGKWHLGMDWTHRPKEPGREGDAWDIDYTRPTANGPNTVGFDEYFGISASLDMPPFAFIENDRVTVVPTVTKEWLRKGAAAPDFEAADVLPTLTRKAVDYLKRRSGDANAGTPFFLYWPLTAPHTPIVPIPPWRGRSGLGDYADFVMQTDAAIGEVLDALDPNGMSDRTLVIVTSDNGCSPAAGIPKLERQGHYPSGPIRGAKADIWEGGHRIPFIARWPGHVPPGSTSNQLICLTDLLATCAEILGESLPGDAGEDSVSVLPALTNTARGPLREAVVHHSVDGKFAIRQGPWKLEFCPGSGGWSKPGDKEASNQRLPPVQLYNLADDPGETTNRQSEQPELVKRLTRLLEAYISTGRSTPGPPRSNDAKIDLRKTPANGPKTPPKLHL